MSEQRWEDQERGDYDVGNMRREFRERLYAARDPQERVKVLEKALRALYDWYNRDGSVGGAAAVFEEHEGLLHDNGRP